jgi:hypothetical protein
MRIHEKHVNGATLEIVLDNVDTGATREEAYSFVRTWRESQPEPEPEEEEDPEKGKRGATAYFSAEQKRTYDIDNGPHNYAPVIDARSDSQISLRVRE